MKQGNSGTSFVAGVGLSSGHMSTWTCDRLQEVMYLWTIEMFSPVILFCKACKMFICICDTFSPLVLLRLYFFPMIWLFLHFALDLHDLEFLSVCLSICLYVFLWSGDAVRWSLTGSGVVLNHWIFSLVKCFQGLQDLNRHLLHLLSYIVPVAVKLTLRKNVWKLMDDFFNYQTVFVIKKKGGTILNDRKT